MRPRWVRAPRQHRPRSVRLRRSQQRRRGHTSSAAASRLSFDVTLLFHFEFASQEAPAESVPGPSVDQASPAPRGRSTKKTKKRCVCRSTRRRSKGPMEVERFVEPSAKGWQWPSGALLHDEVTARVEGGRDLAGDQPAQRVPHNGAAPPRIEPARFAAEELGDVGPGGEEPLVEIEVVGDLAHHARADGHSSRRSRDVAPLRGHADLVRREVQAAFDRPHDLGRTSLGQVPHRRPRGWRGARRRCAAAAATGRGARGPTAPCGGAGWSRRRCARATPPLPAPRHASAATCPECRPASTTPPRGRAPARGRPAPARTRSGPIPGGRVPAAAR